MGDSNFNNENILTVKSFFSWISFVKPNLNSMKKQVLFVFAFLILGLLNTRAQLRIAITGGPQIASVPANYSPGWDTISYQFSSRTGWRAGLLTDIHFSPRSIFYLQSGMFYSNKGRNLTAKFDTALGTLSHVNGLQYLNYFEFPLNLVLKLK